VVIPTYNRVAQLRRVLSALEQQTFPMDDFEVAVVPDGSDDGTVAYLKTWQTPLRLLPLVQTRQGASVARNLGVAAAQGEIIIFLDDDVVPAPQLIAEHVRSHAQNGDEAIVLGPMLPPPDFTLSAWVRWEQAMLE